MIISIIDNLSSIVDIPVAVNVIEVNIQIENHIMF